MGEIAPTLVTCYVNPDLDGIAGAIAYAEFLQKNGKHAAAGIVGEFHDEAKYLFRKFTIPLPKFIENGNAFNEIILVDASELSGLDGKIDPDKIIEIIDHRKFNEADKFQKAKIQIELVGAAATLIAEKFMQAHYEISKSSALLLYSAIISNTLNFHARVTTDRDREASEWLKQKINPPLDFTHELFLAKSDLSGDKLASRIRGDAAWFTIAGKKICIAQIEIIGVKALMQNRYEEILSVLHEFKKQWKLDFIFQNTIDLDAYESFFVTDDASTQKLLKKIFGVTFTNASAKAPTLLMRKEIVPQIKEELEKHA